MAHKVRYVSTFKPERKIQHPSPNGQEILRQCNSAKQNTKTERFCFNVQVLFGRKQNRECYQACQLTDTLTWLKAAVNCGHKGEERKRSGEIYYPT